MSPKSRSLLSRSLPCLAAALLATSPVAAAEGEAPVASTQVPKSFLEGTYYFNVSLEGGSDVSDALAGLSELDRVRFQLEDRFLAVTLAEDAFSHGKDRSLSSVLARFPMQDKGESVEVFWGDDPTPVVIQSVVRTRRGRTVVPFEAAGKNDVFDFELDASNGYLTFVKRLNLVSKDTGNRVVKRLRYNFLRPRETGYQPKRYESAAERRDFGFFTAGQDMLVDEEIGHLEYREFVQRIDISRPFVYELHPTVPEVCKQPIQDAVESWNDVFEARTGRRPLALRDGAWDHMPGDLRYHVIYFRTRGYTARGYSAYGPPVAIGHTGEIVDADVIVDGTALLGERKRLLAAEAAREEARKEELESTAAPSEKEKRSVEFALGQTVLKGSQVRPDVFRGFSDVMEEIREEIEGKSELSADEKFYHLVRSLMTHEIGHNLGLRHNFAGSADLSNLPEGEWSTSIMDYVKDGEGHLRPGVYDQAAIAWGYDGELRDDERGRYLFLTDHHADFHPLANRHDFGEPLSYYTRILDKALFTALRQGEKPAYPLSIAKRILDMYLFPVAKFVNGMNDPRGQKAYEVMQAMVRFRFDQEAKYTALDYLSTAKLYAAYYLMNLEGLAGNSLTRNQRRGLMQALGEVLTDNEAMLEENRIQLAGHLADGSHVTARNALRQARRAIEERLSTADLSPTEAEIEENVLLAVEKSIRRFMTD